MKISMVYDYSRPKCGIKVYADILTKWLRKLGLDVRVCDLRKEDYSDSIEAALCALNGDLVHTQHEFGLFKGHFGWSQILYYLTLKLYGKFNVTTLHTVLKPEEALSNYVKFVLPFTKEKPWEAIRGLLLSFVSPYIPEILSDRLIVHTVRGYELLPSWIKWKAELIPHFSPVPSKTVLENAKRCKEKSVPDIVKIVTPGFIRPTKRYDWAIRALVALKTEGFEKPIEYTVIGTAQNEDGETWYKYIKELAEKVNQYAKKLGLTVNVVYKHMEKAEIIRRACEADVVLLPYSDPTQEASGILHDSLVCGRHIVVLEIGDVKNYPQAFYPFNLKDPVGSMKEALKKAIGEVLKGNRCNLNALAYAYFTSIDVVARRHKDFYSKLRS